MLHSSKQLSIVAKHKCYTVAMKKATKTTAKKTTHKKTAKKLDFEPTYVALAVSSVAVISLVAFAVIGWSMSL
jgi:hypothetical protein